MSDQVKITLANGSVREYPKGITPFEIAKGISESLARNAIAASVNDNVVETNRPIEQDATLKLLMWDDEGGKYTFWHSSAHILAEAILTFYPEAKLAIGPPIENGFYYDIDFGDASFSQENFEKIEKKFLELASSGEKFVRKEVSKAEALSFYKKENNAYKLELIENLQDGDITFYESGKFTDLCRGPHVPDSRIIKAVKILNIAGAYWRGNEKNKQLTRVYAISFPKASELQDYLKKLEEAKKRDHRKLGKELELFTFSEKVGMGLPLWLPKGTIIREELEQFLRRLQRKAGYQPVVTPNIGQKELYICSGHYAKYGADSFQSIKTPDENEEFMLKPMNCPHHCEIYKSSPRSYKELPLRFAEFGTVYRYEQSGELHGLIRVRGFTQDDAHLFCEPAQVKAEFLSVIDLVLYIFKIFDFQDYSARISVRDTSNKEKYIGSDELWEKAERSIIEACQEKGLKAEMGYGEAAFYGPKLDFMVRDAIGRKWQLGTIQIDYNLPERFELEYIGADNQKHRPVMIHRAPFGSLERFIAVLLEHTGGDFPVWLAPVQATVLPISDRFNDYAASVQKRFQDKGLRVDFDDRGEKIGKKIRDAEMQKIPYMLVVGEKEMQDGSVALRKHKHGDIGTQTCDAAIEFLLQEIQTSLQNPLSQTP